MPVPTISNYSALMELQSAPINPAWILEGTPNARNRVIAPSTDRFGWTMLWDCTAGKFNWHYSLDETVHIIDGSVTVTDSDGRVVTLNPGDIAFFPKGSVAHWHVDNYVRKVAYCQKPVPSLIALPVRVFRKILTSLRKAISLVELEPVREETKEASAQPAVSFKKTAKSA